MATSHITCVHLSCQHDFLCSGLEEGELEEEERQPEEPTTSTAKPLARAYVQLAAPWRAVYCFHC